MTIKDRATELEFLLYFYQNADFGPADAYIRYGLKENFKEDTDKELPEGFDDEE